MYYDSKLSAGKAYRISYSPVSYLVPRNDERGTGNRTADSSLSHSLPSITITFDHAVRIYSLANSPLKVYETTKLLAWEAPSSPFGTSFTSPDHLTAAINNEYHSSAATWTESSSPYTVKYGITLRGIVGQSSIQLSPSTGEAYQGEKRTANITGTFFEFYYDGSNIVYRTSTDDGITVGVLFLKKTFCR